MVVNGVMLASGEKFLAGLTAESQLSKQMVFNKNAIGRTSSTAALKVETNTTIITNKLPVSTDGKVMGEFVNGQPKMLGNTNAAGTFDFVVTEGKVLLGRKHSFLSGGENVQAAGEILIKNGQVRAVNNASGHYLPNLKESRNFLKILQNNGVNVDKAHLNIYGENGKLLEHITPTSNNRSSYINP